MSIFLCLHGCNQQKTEKKLKDEKIILEKFFRYLLLDGSGIYTLVGSKPITSAQLFYEESKETKQKKWDRLSKEEKQKRILIINRDNPEDMSFYKNLSKEIKKNAFLVSDNEYTFDQSKVLNNWHFIENLPISDKYLLIKKYQDTFNFEGESIVCYDIIFVNILETALILKKYYYFFRDAVGFDFDTMQIIMELKNEESEFWNKINDSKHALLWGLLFGFGEKNSFSFDLVQNKNYNFSNVIQKYNSSEEFIPIPSINNFSIPQFMSFSKEDPIIKKYEKERKQIQKEYQGKNFLKNTLDIICVKENF